MSRLIFFILLTTAILSQFSASLSEETEHDSCTCKQVQAGAQSTLKGGTCVRTEASNCLMEWGTRNNQKVGVGNGVSQTEAASKAEQLITKGTGKPFELEKFAPVGDDNTPLRIAIANLSSCVPPEIQ